MDSKDLHATLEQLTRRIAGRAIDATLEDGLNRDYAPGSPAFLRLQQLCEAGVAAGWLCQREAAGIRYGRVFQPEAALHNFSVDVVDMAEVAGPHHTHPNGEIDLRSI